MPLTDLFLALAGILVTSLPIVLIKVNFKRFEDDGSNEFIQMGLNFIFIYIQIEFWKILFYGMETYQEENILRNGWPLVAVVAYLLLVLRPIRKLVYPGNGRSLIGRGKGDKRKTFL